MTHTGGDSDSLVRPNYRVIIPAGSREGHLRLSRVVNVDSVATAVTTVITALAGTFGWRADKECGGGKY